MQEKKNRFNFLWTVEMQNKPSSFSFFQTIDDTMCEDTVFWDLNYSIQYKSLGVGDTMTKVLKVTADFRFEWFASMQNENTQNNIS